MVCEQLFKQIDELNEFYINVWKDVCNIESPTAYKAGVDAVADYFEKMAKERMWEVERLKQNVSGDVLCITMNHDVKNAPVTLSGHIDTVHSVGSFGNSPVRIDGDKIYGPGVTDCKGGVVAAFCAMDALERSGFKNRPVKLLIQSDEEKGSNPSKKETINYICKKAEQSVAFINMEGHTAGEACLERKGILNFVFTVNGVEAHSSKCAQSGANAVAEAAHKIIEIEKIKNSNGITCCCSIINGGTATNTVPGKCEFVVNVRFATEQQRQWIINRMQDIADTVYVPGCKTVLEKPQGRYAMELSKKNIELLQKMNEIFTHNGLPVLTASKRTGGSDAADVTCYGIPCVDSLGIRGGEIHTINEYAYIDSLAESAKRVAAVVYCI